MAPFIVDKDRRRVSRMNGLNDCTDVKRKLGSGMRNTHQHHFEERAVFAGGGVRGCAQGAEEAGWRRWGRVRLDWMAWLVVWG